MEDLPSPQFLRECEGSVDELIEAYGEGVQSIINHNDPSCSKINSLRPELLGTKLDFIWR